MDTLEFVRELKAAGFTDAQAEAVTRVVRRVHEADVAAAITRADLRAELAETKTDILKWVIGAMAFQTVAILAGALALQQGLS